MRQRHTGQETTRTRTPRRPVAALLAGMVLAAALAGCGKASEVEEPQRNVPRDSTGIGVLLPGSTDRWENYDRPSLEQAIGELCPACTVRYASARDDAAVQQRQMDAMITQGVRVIILAAVDSKSLSSAVEKAREAGIDVLAYDRFVEGPISGFVSFDGEWVGRLQGEALLEALGDKAADSQIVMMNGSPTDANSAWFKKGALAALEGKVKIGKSYDTPGWRPIDAHLNMSGAIAALGADRIDGVYSANDGVASGVIAALKSAGIQPLPPVTGQDAELAAIQRIVQGDQYMTVYKPFTEEADRAAELAVAVLRGWPLDAIAARSVAGSEGDDIPAVMLKPVTVTADNIRDTVVRDGVYTIDQICTPKYASGCERAGLIGQDAATPTPR